MNLEGETIMRTISAIAIALVVTLAFAGSPAASVPDLIPVQGVLTDSVGNVINGDANVRFALYDAATNGTQLWAEIYNGAYKVHFDYGFFTVYLGTRTTLLFEDLLDADELWLGITVGLDEEMARVRLAAVPFAQEAKFCQQIGTMVEEDIQTALDFSCGGSQFLRGWDPVNGPICETDLQADLGDAGLTGLVDVNAGAGLLKNPVPPNEPTLSVAFGTTAGTVAAGNHAHTGYQPLLNGTVTCPAGSFVSNINPATGVVTCAAESAGALYTAGFGLNLAGEEFEINMNLIQVRLSASCGVGQFVASINPATGAVTCATPAGASYTAGEGMIISGGNELAVNFETAQRRVGIGGDTNNGTCPVGQVVKAINPATGALTCVVDQTTGSGSGEIVSVTGVAPIVSTDDGAGHVQIEVTTGTTAGTVATGNHTHPEFSDFADYDETISAITCTVGQVVKHDGTGWICANDLDENTTYTASAGVTLMGTNFTADTAYLQRRVGSACAEGQAIRAIDAAGAVTCQALPSYTAGTGLSLTGTQFAVNTTAIQARVAGTCAAGSSIRTIGGDGSVVCQADTTYTAGTGLQLTGTTFAASIGTTAGTVAAGNHDHTGAYLPAQTCAEGYVLKYISGAWTCAADNDANTTYTAGTGLTLAGTVFSADVNYLQRRVSATCAAGQSIRAIAADGTVTCEVDDDTAYTAGTGLSLTGTQFAVNTTTIQSRVTGTCAAGNYVRAIAADGSVTCQPDTDTNTTYTAGSGLTLTGTIFAASFAGSGSANTSARSDHDHTGTYLPATTCTVGYVLKATASGWDCAQDNDTDTTYTAGTGLTLSGTAFSADAAYLQRRVSATCAAGNSIRAIAADGTVTCEPDDDTNTTYTAGTGLTLTGTAFSANTSVLQNRVSGTCAAGSSIQTIAADGTVTCHTDVDTNTTYTAGSGLALAGTAFAVSWGGTGSAATASRSDHAHSAYTYTAGTGLTLTGSAFSADMTYLQRRVSGTCGAGWLVKAVDPASGVITCAEDQTTGSGGGEIVSLDGISPVVVEDDGLGHAQVSVLTGTTSGTLALGDHGHAEFADFADYDEPLEGIDTCTNGQVLKYNTGTAAWECGNDVDTNTTYSAGTALTLAGTTFNVSLGTTSATAAAGNHTHAAYTYTAGTGLTLAGTTFSADAAYLQRRVSGTCAAGSSIATVAADGTVTCEADDNTTYTASTGLTLTGTAFAVNTTAIQARVTGTCAAGSSISAIAAGGTVTCQTDTNTTYTAGNGLQLAGTTFSASYGGTGTATTLSRSDHDHAGTYLPATTCTVGYVLKATAGGWACAADEDTTYTAGSGLSLSGTAFSVNTSTIQARVGSTCAAGNSIRAIAADGTVTCEPDDDTNTTYTAGTGLTLSGTTFSANTTVLQNRVTGTCAAGSSIREITAAGGVTCQADTNTTYTASTGLTLSGTAFSADTSVVQARVSGTCAAGSSIRTIDANGAVSCQTDSNTTYAAGNGLTLTGTTFAASYAGTGSAYTLARSDHNHDTYYSPTSHNHNSSYILRTGDTVSTTSTYSFTHTGSSTVPFAFYNESTSTSPTYGLYAANNSPKGGAYGVYGRVYDATTTSCSGDFNGLRGYAYSNNASRVSDVIGVMGEGYQQSSTSSTYWGIGGWFNGYAYQTGGVAYGVRAYAYAGSATGTAYAVYASTAGISGSTRYAGYFSGDVLVTGDLTVSGGAGSNLFHSCIYAANTANSATVASACPSGWYALSGGCSAGATSIYVVKSYPANLSGVGPGSGEAPSGTRDRWFCQFTAANAANTTYTMCCQY
jgi:hypothetical protein